MDARELRRYFRTLAVAFAVSLAPGGAAAALDAPAPASSAPPRTAGLPDLALTMALVAAGGGPTAFDPQKVVNALRRTRTPAPTRPIAGKEPGSDETAAFITTFRFFMTDALAQLAKTGEGFPSPLPQPDDAKALSAALFTAGVTSEGTFNVDYLLDTLVSHPVHARVMADIDANPDLGAAADADFRAALGDLIAGPAPVSEKRK